MDGFLGCFVGALWFLLGVFRVCLGWFEGVLGCSMMVYGVLRSFIRRFVKTGKLNERYRKNMEMKKTNNQEKNLKDPENCRSFGRNGGTQRFSQSDLPY